MNKLTDSEKFVEVADKYYPFSAHDSGLGKLTLGEQVALFYNFQRNAPTEIKETDMMQFVEEVVDRYTSNTHRLIAIEEKIEKIPRLIRRLLNL